MIQEDMKAFYKSAIDTHNEMIHHYDVIIKDISSEIANDELERNKAPILDFLHNMKNLWEQSLKDNKERADSLKTNWDRLCELPIPQYYRESKALYTHPLREYIDYEAYFKSNDRDITHFIRSIGSCYVKPSDTQIKSTLNEGKDVDFEWLIENTAECLLLEYTKMYGEDYAVVADLENMRTMSVPVDKIVIKKNDEG